MSVDHRNSSAAPRPATKADAGALAQLIDLAGEGIPSHLWAEAARAGETALDVGAQRAAREEGGFSYRNAFVIEAEGRAAGMLLGYRQPDPYDPGDLSALPGIIRPMVALEALAPGSWYVNALAVFPEFHGRGLGSRLLALADDLADESGADRLSVITAAANERAFALYRHHGYREIARRPIVAFAGFEHGGDWVLLVKDVA